ncbi:hypothetical protein VTJ49DRAFT_7095 [Mycothermus thermophilus]|uniref:Uncharacterized protein n=1 Tax=Humicola insolens TaxID=85995 RepID=A0ABR3VHS1_HUMIN
MAKNHEQKAAKNPTVWDNDAHLALLNAVMAEAPPAPHEWDRILARVAEKGYHYTASAAIASPTMASARMTWDQTADHHLMLALVQELAPGQDQLEGVRLRMHEFGHKCTVKAITQHLQKLRRKDEAKKDGDGSATTPKPGRKRATKKEPGSSTTKRKKGAANPEDDDESVETPSKKPKVKKEADIKQEPDVKEESDDDDIVKVEDSDEYVITFSYLLMTHSNLWNQLR